MIIPRYQPIRLIWQKVFLLILFLGLSVTTQGNLQRAKDRAVQPNIVLFLVDDLGWQESSVPFYSEVTELNRRYRTPAMEEMARRGMKFRSAYASAVCSPSRVSLLSGMNAARHRVTNWTLRKDQSPDDTNEKMVPPLWNLNGATIFPGIARAVQITPLPALLREAGYRTIQVGKAHLGAVGTPGEDPRHFGYDINVAGHAAGAPGSYRGEKNFRSPTDSVWDVPGLEAYHGQNIHLTEALTREAIRHLEGAVESKRPFFLSLSHYAVHSPWEEDDRFYPAYRDAGLGHFEALRASMIEGMDRSLGDLLRTLRRLDIDRQTLVIFLSDNGAPHACPPNLPLRGQKLSPYEGGARVPMLALWPGTIPAGSEVDTPVIIEDIFPTLLAVAGQEMDPQRRRQRIHQVIDGENLLPILRGGPFPASSRPLLFHFPHQYYGQGPFSALRKDEWKLIYHHLEQRLELFHLPTDIGEAHDLSQSKPTIRRKLAGLLSRELQRHGAQMPIKATSRKGEETSLPLPAAHDRLR
jgi:arylsulfatase A-like enzyme